MQLLAEHRCHGGRQQFWRHASSAVGLPMRFGLYLPPQAAARRVPAIVWLAGLTCTDETFAIKAGAQQHAARHGVALVMPDTSPRETGIDGAETDWEFGAGAGFYLDATEAPWSPHWRMESYVVDELPTLLAAHAPIDVARLGLSGHSMGGHGALTLALRHPQRWRSVSAFAPIVAPSRVPWGRKAFRGYLGDDHAAWSAHDATALVEAGARVPPLLVDQGEADPFLANQLHPELFEAACRAAGQPLELRRHAGYDHGYYFVSSFIADHVAHHARTLC